MIKTKRFNIAVVGLLLMFLLTGFVFAIFNAQTNSRVHADANGENWTLSGGVLTISGSGYVEISVGESASSVTEIIVKDGVISVTALGEDDFCNVTKITLPQGIEEFATATPPTAQTGTLDVYSFESNLFFADEGVRCVIGSFQSDGNDTYWWSGIGNGKNIVFHGTTLKGRVDPDENEWSVEEANSWLSNINQYCEDYELSMSFSFAVSDNAHMENAADTSVTVPQSGVVLNVILPSIVIGLIAFATIIVWKKKEQY